MFSSEHDNEKDRKVRLLQLKLKTVTKMKVSAERQIYKLNNAERSLCEELHLTKSEIDLVTEQLEDLKDKITESACQISKIEAQKEAERSKTESYICNLNNWRNGFDFMFAEERSVSKLRKKELMDREAEKQELERKRREELCRQKERQNDEAKVIEEECVAIERECAVLKKRNAAVMLKLRKQLVEVEETRRALITQTQGSAKAKK